MRLKPAGAVLALAGLALAASVLFFGLRAKGAASGLKNFAETKVGQLLKAEVKVGEVKVGFLNRIALRQLQIAPESDPDRFNFQVDEVVFRYDLIGLVTQNLEAPASIFFKTPDISIKESEFPYELVQDLNFGSGARRVSRLEFSGGRIRYRVPRLDTEIDLRDVHGMMQPMGLGKVYVKFEGKSSGFLNGDLTISGEIDPIKRSHQLKLKLGQVTLSEKIPLPIDSAVGMIRWEDGSLYFDQVEARVHGWNSEMKGSLRNLGEAPELILDWNIGGKEPLGVLSIRADLGTGELGGAVQVMEREPNTFRGKIEREGKRIRFKELWVNDVYRGEGDLDFETGAYRFDLARDRQKISIESNLRGLEFDLNIGLSHFRLYGLDLVMNMHTRVVPQPAEKEGGRWRFKGEFRTDYFVLEYTPFNDFRGKFTVDASGVRDLSARWGEVFSLRGNIPLKESLPEADLVMEISGFPLEQVQEMAAKPLPKQLGGLLEGKIKIQGPLARPEWIGDLSIKDGRLGQLQYDRGILHFRGFLPYLPLDDSKVLRGRTTLRIQGALDFSLPNIFHGIRVETADQFVLWKGWEVHLSEVEGDMEIDPVLSRLPTLALKGGLESTRADFADPDGAQDDNYVTVGPKIKF